MRDLLSSSSTRLAMIAGAALFVAACGDGGEATNNSGIEELDSNMMLDTLGNDASALESIGNAGEPLPPVDTGNQGVEANQGTESTDVLGTTSGGDTGGNTVESNVSAM